MLKADDRPPRNPCATSSLIALKPRQVLLAERQQQKPRAGWPMTNKQQLQLNHISLKPELKPSLVHCILHYLHKNGFSKTIKRFRKEAQIENDNWKDISIDLEDIYSRYLENSRDADANFRVCKEQGGTMEKDGVGLCAAPEETFSKKKKKSKRSKENAVATPSEVDKYGVVDSGKALMNEKVTAKHSSLKEEKGKKSDSFNQSAEVTHGMVHELKADESIKKQKDKKNKKKSKLASNSLADHEKQTDLLSGVIGKGAEAFEVSNNVNIKASEETDKSKDRKKKHKRRTISLVEDGQETKNRMVGNSDATDIPMEDSKIAYKEKKKKEEVLVSKKLSDNGSEVLDKGTSLKTSENGTNKESKKRKLSASDPSDSNLIEKLATRESKHRKIEELEEAKGGKRQGKLKTVPEGDGHTDEEIKEDSRVGEKEPQNACVKQVDQSTKEDLMKNGVLRFAEQKSERKQWNGSAEPKTAHAFQRVKVDEVKFADERLQDNSYWAKDGAELGYGAKAQEILGLVRGRNFRHEKIKKKRGSYRGGQIDVHSHSVKFNYSDDE